ncbi:Sodium/potassium/calcium exchanger 5 [Pseudolycoriella hygida]|uniref:Sodium/potassium/calcium exchanger 5 n=1 Tax=Pseudolycoriella hygida TaxID=35572 RepID=A0A9Q0MQZ0_9DIPT|nr:Sodium/potassium/calcium exchanger 5 [Pseudolycoriella hygida]
MKILLVLLLVANFSARKTFADEQLLPEKQIAVIKHPTEETSINYLISALNERYAKNQARDSQCMVNSSIDEFPQDIFTNEQRQSGAIFIHLLGAIYFFTFLAVVCNDYFLPSVECICNDLNISKDVAAATFMATATTTPELFTNIISTFIMDSDMGVGTIIGSLMFNTLGVAAIAGLASIQRVKLEWWPITRDSILYSLNLLILIWFSWDSKITLSESIVLVVLYFVYFVILFQNNRIMKFFIGLFAKKSSTRSSKSYDLPPQLNKSLSNNDLNNNPSNQDKQIFYIHDESNCQPTNQVEHSLGEDNVKVGKSLWKIPKGGWCRRFWWFYTWPIKFILTLTIPSPKTYKKLYPLTFFLCVIFIGSNSYLIVWMVTVVGYTYSIPESVMGLTLLAAGGCMPEAISSVIMIRKGESGIGVSNSLGANSLAILMSLGVPWLIRNIVYHNTTDKSFITLNSFGIEYTIVSLLAATVLLYAVLACAKYHLNKPVGFSLLTIYSIFLTVGILIELDVIFPSGNCV